MNTRSAVMADTEAIVDLHSTAFSGFFLTALGKRFLTELYRGFINLEGGICLVADEDNRVVGFVAGTTSPETFFRRLLVTRWFAFGFAAIPALVRRPMRIFGRLIAGAFYRGGGHPDRPDAALLSSIGVQREFVGKGIGSALIDSFCNRAKTQGVSAVYLETDADDNEAVNRVYLRSGFKYVGCTVRSDGRRMNHYLRNI